MDLVNKYAKIIFKNGMACEGIIKSWNNEFGILTDEKSQKDLYIYNVFENVLLMKISWKEVTENNTCVQQHLDVQQCHDERLNEAELRAQRLVELHKIKAQEEKNALSRRMKIFTPTRQLVTYGSPNFTK